MRTIELLAEHGLYFIGDVKTGTRRFVPKAEYEEGTAQENGAWSTWTSELKLGGDKVMPIYAVSHRRGESIHCFVSNCGTTLPGKSHMAYFEDDEERAMGTITEHEIARKCPAVLNDFTLAQPTIDRSNRYRQHILAMEKRLVTNNFSFRFFTSMLGILVTNCFFAHRYFNKPDASFKEEMDRLALKLMNNPLAKPLKPAKSGGAACSPCGKEGEHHHLISLRQFLGLKPGQKSGKQMDCTVCGTPCSWVCAECSDHAKSCVPCCPLFTVIRKDCAAGPAGTRVAHDCLAKHMLNPEFVHKKAKRGSAKRRKRAPTADDDEDA